MREIRGISAKARENYRAVTKLLEDAGSIDGLFTPPHRELLKQIPPMSEGNLVSVCTPVIACGDQETVNLERTLRLLGEQRMPQSAFEVVVFLNRPQGTPSDGTVEVVREASRRMHNIRCIEAEIPLARAGWTGYIRSLLHAVVSQRARMRRWGARELVHLVLDADTVGMHPDLIAGHLRRLHETGADECIGQLDWNHPEAPTREIPALLVSTRFFLEMLWQTGKRIVEDAYNLEDYNLTHLIQLLFGENFFPIFANASFTDEAYRRIGGYDPDARILEECILFRSFWLSRQMRGDLRGLCFGTQKDGVVVASSTRRALWALCKLNPPRPVNLQWDYTNDMGDASIRTSIPDLDGFRTRKIYDAELLVNMICQTLTTFPLPPEILQNALPKALRSVGVKKGDYNVEYTPVPSEPLLCLARIQITDTTGLCDWVRKQQAREEVYPHMAV